MYQADLLCIHAELHDLPPYPSDNLINQNVLAQLKSGCVIINAARGGIINEEDLLNSPKALTYCTDVYLNEPSINKHIINKALLCTPHIAGHSLEAKYLAVAMISAKLHQLLNVPTPKFAVPQLPSPLSLTQDADCYESVLGIYNPLEETIALKQAIDKKTAFLNWRKKHQNRHNFSCYFQDKILNDKTRILLGM